jgi:hypothetical protein
MRFAIVLILISFYPYTSFSQQNSIGIKFAPSISFYSYKILNSETQSNNLTYSFGTSYQRDISKSFSCVIELGYDYQKHTMPVLFRDPNNNEYNTDMSTYFHYIDVPLLFRYNYGTSPKVFVNVGISNSFRISANQKVESQIVNSDFNGYTNKYNIGVLSGIGLSQSISKSLSISFETRFRFGLTNQLNVTTANIKGNVLYAISSLNYNF